VIELNFINTPSECRRQRLCRLQSDPYPLIPDPYSLFPIPYSLVVLRPGRAGETWDNIFALLPQPNLSSLPIL